MEARTRKYRDVSPERAIVWTHKSPKYKQTRKVAVVYYLCRNRHLDHPHFMEVPISSPKGLYLKDVTNRFNALRGTGMSSLYSWSSKRSYKNGFVWHDLCEDDLILPSNGNEYVLKGSEYFEGLNSDHLIRDGNLELKNAKQSPLPASSTNFNEPSSSSSVNGKNSKHYQDDLSPPARRPSSSDVSPESRVEKSSSSTGSLTLTEYKIYKNDGLADASTQTEKNVSHQKALETCTRGVSTDEGSSKPASSRNQHNIAPVEKEASENRRGEISPPSSSSSSSSCGKIDTLESLIKADESKMNSFRIPEEEVNQMMPNAKFSAADALMQLISCGSISVKDHSFGLIPTYKPRFNHSKLQSPFLSTSVMLGEIDYLLKPRPTDLGLVDKEYLSGSFIETKKYMQEGDGVTDNALKQSSAYNVNRGCKQLGASEDKEEAGSGRSRCMPLSIRASAIKHPESGPMARNSYDGVENSQIGTSGVSERIAEPWSGRKQSKKQDSLTIYKEKVIRSEESFLQERGL